MSQNNKTETPKVETPKTETVTLINTTKGLRRVLNRKVLPDNVGIEITAEEFELLKKGKAFQAQLKDGEFKVK